MRKSKSESKSGLVADMIRREICSGTYPGGGKIPSEHQLANRTGFSRTTVRRAVMELEKEGLVQRIQGSGTYVMGERRVSARTRRIGVMTDGTDALLLAGIVETLADDGYTAMVETAVTRRQEEECLTRFQREAVDGVLAEGVRTALPGANPTLYLKLQEQGIPVVFMGSCPSVLKKPVCVGADDHNGGRILGERLISEGHRRIAAFFRWDDLAGVRRYTGLLQAVTGAGLSLADENVLWFVPEDRDVLATARAKQLLSGCTAAVCQDEETMRRIRKEAREPLQWAFFRRSGQTDQLETADAMTLVKPSREMGVQAARKLLNILCGKRESPLTLDWLETVQAE